MRLNRLLILILLIFTWHYCEAQTDSALQHLRQVPAKYINQVDNKIDQYSNRITNKTEKTLVKLSRFENKIKSLLLKANPEAAERLFGAGKTTFTTLLQKYQQGQTITEGYKARYDEYRDKLTTSIQYLDNQKQNLDTKLLQPVSKTTKKLTELEDEVKQQEAVEAFIKERKKLLFDESLKYIGKSKYLSKINSESYYYVETIKNYKAIFSDKKKAEETALTILNKIPAFSKFVQENGMLARLFGSPSAGGATASLAGLQTRASVNALIQNQIAAGGPNAQAQIQQNFQAAQAELSKLKDKILKAGGNSSGGDMPSDEYGHFNPQRSKTFLQKLELGTNFQTTKSNGYFPTTTDLGVSIGFKQSNSLTLGIGASYKLGLGSDISHIKFSNAGAGLRSFIEYKLKKSIWLSGGAEMNYRNTFSSLVALQQFDAWQTSALLGLSKKYKISKKMKGNMQLMYDFLYLKSVPVKQSPVVFRVGYAF